MFANNEVTDRGLLHKLLRTEAGKVTADERRVWAHSIEGAIKDASQPSTLVRLRLTHPAVVAAAAPALSAVAATLRDVEDVVVSREALDAVRKFMTDGIDSPLFGRDPLAAHRAADELRNLVTGRIAQRPREVAHAGAA